MARSTVNRTNPGTGSAHQVRTDASAANMETVVLGVDGSDSPVTVSTIGTSLALATVGAPYTATSGSITTATSTVTTGNIGLAGNVTAYIFGTYAGVNVTFEASPDNTNWFAWPMQNEQTGVIQSTTGVLASNAASSWTIDAPGFSFFRVRATAFTSGTASVLIAPGTYPFTTVVSAIVSPLVGTPAKANVGASASSVTLRAANAARKGLMISNQGTANLYVDLTGGTATTTTANSFVLGVNASWVMDSTTFTTGLVTGIWTATGGNGANVTEFT